MIKKIEKSQTSGDQKFNEGVYQEAYNEYQKGFEADERNSNTAPGFLLGMCKSLNKVFQVCVQ